jgi:ribonuclease I
MGLICENILVTVCAALFVAGSNSFWKESKHINFFKMSVGGSSYDRYIFATEWPGTVCLFNKCMTKINGSHFNIHGLWPSTAGDSPQNCQALYFDESNLSPYLQSNLYNYWTACFKDNWTFMKHELKTHGTCWDLKSGDTSKMDQGIAKIIAGYNPSDQFSNINTYMTIVLFLSQKMDPLKVLQSAGVTPGDGQKFPIDQFLAIFNKSFNLSTGVFPVCLRQKSSGEDFLSELRFCLDLQYEPMDCDPVTVKQHIQQCGSDPVFYPKFDS